MTTWTPRICSESARQIQTMIDTASHAKYDRYGPKIVTTVVGREAHAVTVKLVPTGD